MVLLDVLAHLSRAHGWQLTVAHFNHQLRGRSSDADERLVERTAKKLRLPFISDRANVRKFAAEHSLSLEMAARKLRHEFLARTAAKLRIKKIALAHHADDQVELFFLRLLRGAGGEGLAGMKWQSPSPANPNIKLVRPLLDQPKSALAAYAKSNGVPFREDATNAQRDILRNRIRHELLPLLRKQYQPALDRVILRQMEILAAESEFVSQAIEKHSRRKSKKSFSSLPLALQRRRLQSQLINQGLPANFELVEVLRLRPKQFVSVSHHVAVQRDTSGAIQIREATNTSHASRLTPQIKKLKLKGRAGDVRFENARIYWEITHAHGTFRAPKRRVNCERFDAAKLGKTLILRHWQPGDRFQPIGMASSVKLQNLFINQKVPREQRHQLLVGATAKGEIFWVEGLRLGERFKLDNGTRYQLKWRWERL